MNLLDHALSVLEFDQVLALLSEHCQADLARQLALELRPTFEPGSLIRALEFTQESSQFLDQETAPPLGSIRDLHHPLDFAGKGGTLDGADLHRIAESMATMRALRVAVGHRNRFPLLEAEALGLPDLPALEERLFRSLDGSGEVRDEATPELAKLRQTKRQMAGRLQERIQSYVSGPHREHLSDPIVTQRAGRYVVPVRAEHRGKIKGIVHDTSATGHTLFVEPLDVLETGNALREAEAAERAEVERILAELSSRVGAVGKEIAHGLTAAAEFDLRFAKVRFGHQMRGCVPHVVEPGTLKINKGIHPLLGVENAVPLSLELGTPAVQAILITGPNTGGKTVAIKTVGLFMLMAHCGMMWPAAEGWVGEFSQVWADIGDEQSLEQSLSTFSGHIKNIADALRAIRPNALVLLDEVGAGTDPAEGAALAKAILSEFASAGAKILASTHYGELKVFASNTPGFINSSMEFDLKSLGPTYRLLIGTPGASHALRIAERYGLPKRVISLAQADAGVSERDVAHMLEQLEVAQKRAIKAQSEADRLAHHLRTVEREAEEKLALAHEKAKTAKQRAADAVEDELRKIRAEAHELFKSVKAGAGAAPSQKARDTVKRLSEQGDKLARELRPQAAERPAAVVKKGTEVRVDGYTQTGVVLEDPKGTKVRIQVGMLKMTVELKHLSVLDKPTVKPRAPQKNLQFERIQTAKTEIEIRGMRAELAMEVLDRFIDESLLAGLKSVRIVHGKGEGILRQLTGDFLRKHRGVAEFVESDPNEGGAGVTIVRFK